jgi:phosphopantetheine adenylyltransferase
LTDLELLIKTFELGMMRRSGIRCDAMMCAQVAAKLRELQKRMENEKQ